MFWDKMMCLEPWVRNFCEIDRLYEVIHTKLFDCLE